MRPVIERLALNDCDPISTAFSPGAGYRINPFAAVAQLPERNRFFFDAADCDCESLANRFRALPCPVAALVGPHGTGKSTLLFSLARLLRSHYRETTVWLCRPRWKDHGLDQSANFGDIVRSLQRDSLTLVDGLEGASAPQRFRLVASAQMRRAPLLLTLHRPQPGVRELFRTRGRLATCMQIVQQRLAAEPELIPVLTTTLRQRWPNYNGNLREALFDMYDAFESHYELAGSDLMTQPAK